MRRQWKCKTHRLLYHHVSGCSINLGPIIKLPKRKETYNGSESKTDPQVKYAALDALSVGLAFRRLKAQVQARQPCPACNRAWEAATAPPPAFACGVPGCKHHARGFISYQSLFQHCQSASHVPAVVCGTCLACGRAVYRPLVAAGSA